MTDLGFLYDDHAENLRSLFEFGDGTQTMRGFRDRDHFIRSYPFHPYQYELFQKAIRTLSDQNAFEGRHTSTGERSMLGAFQEVGRAMMGEPLGSLATFDRIRGGPVRPEGVRAARDPERGAPDRGTEPLRGACFEGAIPRQIR